ATLDGVEPDVESFAPDSSRKLAKSSSPSLSSAVGSPLAGVGSFDRGFAPSPRKEVKSSSSMSEGNACEPEGGGPPSPFSSKKEAKSKSSSSLGSFLLDELPSVMPVAFPRWVLQAPLCPYKTRKREVESGRQISPGV